MSNDNSPWYENKSNVWILLFFFFPVGLYALWKNTTISKGIKYSVFGFFGLIFLAGIFSGGNNNSKISEKTNESPVSKAEIKSEEKTAEKTAEEKKEDVKRLLKSEIESLKSATVDKSRSLTKENIDLYMTSISSLIKKYEEGQAYADDKEFIPILEEYKKELIAYQKKLYPYLRSAYQKMLKDNLWEHNVYVDIEGKNNTTIVFRGGIYASNKRIKESQETLSAYLHQLRYKKVIYKWYKGQDDYQYYELKTKSDSEF